MAADDTSPNSSRTARAHRTRRLMTAIGSLLCFAVISLFLTNPTRLVLQADVIRSSVGVSGHVVIYGKVTNTQHHGVRGAAVVVYTKHKVGKKTVDAIAFKASTNATGTYRIEFKDTKSTPSTYYVEFRAGRITSKSVELHAKASHAYEVSAREISAHGFAIFPVGSY
jgi:hypothetical protein